MPISIVDISIALLFVFDSFYNFSFGNFGASNVSVVGLKKKTFLSNSSFACIHQPSLFAVLHYENGHF